MPNRGGYRHLETDDIDELRWWSGLGFAGGFVVTAVIAATILGVGLNIQLGSTSRAGATNVVGSVLGERVYNAHCSACHGSDGEGKVGPAIGGGLVIELHPSIGTQIAVISDGQGAMPSFENTLTPEEIRAVAIFERERLGR